MTARERFLETMLFGTPDRVPFVPGEPREKTLKRWYSEGLPEGKDWFDVVCETIGVPAERIWNDLQPDVNFQMNPRFEEKVLEHKDGHYIVQDWMGNITEISDEYDVTYIRKPKDFVTRKWHKFPVENREDFENMKKRYDPSDPSRYPDDFDERVRKLRDRKGISSVQVNGPFWQLREWCGFEPLCMLLIEDPEFVREMTEFWMEFVSKAMARVLDSGILDYVGYSEDMAYKGKSMISPAMTKEFLQPSWIRWTREVKQAGVPLILMDSDGKVDELIPLWLEADIHGCYPIEVAAGNDINEFRAAYGHGMAYLGGIDKRCIAKGGKVVEDELARNAPVVKDGGFVPSCDHGVPPDISWPDFLHYGRCLAELNGWL